MINTKQFLLAIILATPLAVFANQAGCPDAKTSQMQHEKQDQAANDEHCAQHRKGSRNFARADKNKDGKLSREEAKALPHVDKHFDEIDADKDGTVDREEIHEFMKANMGNK